MIQPKAITRAFYIDRTFREGVDWLAQNTDNAAIGDAIRLLSYLTDTSEEWVWQAVGKRKDAIAENDRKVQVG